MYRAVRRGLPRAALPRRKGPAACGYGAGKVPALQRRGIPVALALIRCNGLGLIETYAALRRSSRIQRAVSVSASGQGLAARSTFFNRYGRTWPRPGRCSVRVRLDAHAARARAGRDRAGRSHRNGPVASGGRAVVCERWHQDGRPGREYFAPITLDCSGKESFAACATTGACATPS